MDKFIVNAGSKLGDGYMCLLISTKLTLNLTVQMLYMENSCFDTEFATNFWWRLVFYQWRIMGCPASWRLLEQEPSLQIWCHNRKTCRVEVIFIGLQLCREGDPFGGICHSLFVNTLQGLRQKHITSLLHIYYDTFSEIRERFSVPPFPGWSWQEFHRRFHRAQIFGIATGAGQPTMMPQDPNQVQDLEKISTQKNEDSIWELVSNYDRGERGESCFEG